MADVLVAVVAGLEDEHDLVDTLGLVAAAQLGDLLRRAHRSAQRAHALLQQLHAEGHVVGVDRLAGEACLVAALLELVPDVRDARLMRRDAVVVDERVAEEVAAVHAARDRLFLVVVAHHRQHDGDVGIDREPGRDALIRLDQRVVLLHPLARVLGLDEGERQRADALARGQVDRLAAAARHPQRRVRLLKRLGDHVARRHPEVLRVPACEGLLHEHARDRVERVAPLIALLLALDQEAAQLGLRARLPGAELEPPVGDQVERGDPLRHARRMVHLRRDLHDSVAKADALGALRRRRQEDLRRRAV